MFVLVSPIQNYKWEDTGRRTAAQPAPLCVPSRNAGQLLGLAKNEQVVENGEIWRNVPDGEPVGVRLSPIHASRGCSSLRRADQARNAVVIEVAPDDLESPLFALLPCCKKCVQQIGVAGDAFAMKDAARPLLREIAS